MEDSCLGQRGATEVQGEGQMTWGWLTGQTQAFFSGFLPTCSAKSPSGWHVVRSEDSLRSQEWDNEGDRERLALLFESTRGESIVLL